MTLLPVLITTTIPRGVPKRKREAAEVAKIKVKEKVKAKMAPDLRPGAVPGVDLEAPGAPVVPVALRDQAGHLEVPPEMEGKTSAVIT